MLWEDIYLDEYIDSSLPDKREFFSNLAKEHIAAADYKHMKRVWEDFRIQNLGEWHDLFVQCDKLLLTDLFKNFNKWMEINPAYFLSAPGLAWQAWLKKTEVKLKLLTEVDMLIMEGKGSRSSMCYVIYCYAKVNDKYMNDHDTNNETYSCIGMTTTCMYGQYHKGSIHLSNYLFTYSGSVCPHGRLSTCSKAICLLILSRWFYFSTIKQEFLSG